MPRLTPDQETDVVQRYLSGDEIHHIASAFDVVVQTVYNIIKRHGVTLRNNRIQSDAVILVDAVKNGTAIRQAARLLQMSQSTATRLIRTHRQNSDLIVRKGRPPQSATLATATDCDLNVARLRLSPFPYPEVLPQEVIDHEFARLRALVLWIDENLVIRPQSSVGLKVCAPFFPNRYEATSKGIISAIQAWRSEKEMRKAVRFQLNHGDPITPHRVLRAITLRCRTPTIFRPAVARFIYERYCRPGGIAWDPCAGYGGRLLGATAARVRYIGTDVDRVTVEGNRRVAQTVGADAALYLSPAETFDPPRVDLVFTSPPYFNRERYSNAENQSWKKYGTHLSTWVECFLRPVIVRAMTALKEGGWLALNVADLRERNAVIPIVDRTITIARESGFQHVETLQMPLASINRKSPLEPILAFQKP